MPKRRSKRKNYKKTLKKVLIRGLVGASLAGLAGLIGLALSHKAVDERSDIISTRKKIGMMINERLQEDEPLRLEHDKTWSEWIKKRFTGSGMEFGRSRKRSRRSRKRSRRSRKRYTC